MQELYASNSIQWGTGAAGVLGIEWFASRWLSLHADYNESFQYRWGSTTSSEDDRSSTYSNYIPYHSNSAGSTKGWILNSSGVGFGLNIYL